MRHLIIVGYRLILMTQPEASPPVPEEEQPRLAAANDSTSTAVSEADADAETCRNPNRGRLSASRNGTPIMTFM